jgi:hypothetical protein
MAVVPVNNNISERMVGGPEREMDADFGQPVRGRGGVRLTACGETRFRWCNLKIEDCRSIITFGGASYATTAGGYPTYQREPS